MRRDGTIRRLRREAGYRTAADLADEVGVPRGTYHRWEREGLLGSDATIRQARDVADRLGCSIDLLAGRCQRDDFSSYC